MKATFLFFKFVFLFLLFFFFKTMSFWLFLLKLVHRTEEFIVSSNSEILCAVKENEVTELRPAKISKYTAQRKVQFGEK